jgi:hypothetical protein
MAEEEQEENSPSRLGWFSAGVLSTLVVMALFVFLEDRVFSSSRVEADTPGTIIEAH